MYCYTIFWNSLLNNFLYDRKNFFESKLIESSAIVGNKKGGIRLEIFKKLLIEIVPLFLYSFILLLLLSTTIMTTEKGDLLYNIYRNELLKEFDSSKSLHFK